MAAVSAAAEESFEDQVANLKSPTAKTRQAAAAALGKSRRREAVAPLSALVRDSDNRVRLEVVDALRLLRDTSAAPALVVSLQDGDPRVREQAISALVEIYSERERGGGRLPGLRRRALPVGDLVLERLLGGGGDRGHARQERRKEPQDASGERAGRVLCHHARIIAEPLRAGGPFSSQAVASSTGSTTSRR